MQVSKINVLILIRRVGVRFPLALTQELHDRRVVAALLRDLPEMNCLVAFLLL